MPQYHFGTKPIRIIHTYILHIYSSSHISQMNTTHTHFSTNALAQAHKQTQCTQHLVPVFLKERVIILTRKVSIPFSNATIAPASYIGCHGGAKAAMTNALHAIETHTISWTTHTQTHVNVRCIQNRKRNPCGSRCRWRRNVPMSCNSVPGSTLSRVDRLPSLTCLQRALGGDGSTAVAMVGEREIETGARQTPRYEIVCFRKQHRLAVSKTPRWSRGEIKITRLVSTFRTRFHSPHNI